MAKLIVLILIIVLLSIVFYKPLSKVVNWIGKNLKKIDIDMEETDNE